MTIEYKENIISHLSSYYGLVLERVIIYDSKDRYDLFTNFQMLTFFDVKEQRIINRQLIILN